MARFQLDGKTALVTGGTGGLGQAICKRLAEAGANVAVGWYGKDSAQVDALVAEINASGKGKAFAPPAANVADQPQVQAMVDATIAEFGALHVVVNNAGYEDKWNFLEMPLEKWQGVINVNLTGPFLVGQAGAREMVKQKSGGVIINISSVHDIVPWATFAHYCAAKAGLTALTQSMTVALAEHRIRAVTVCPGAIATPINQNVWSDPELRVQLENKIPWKKIGQPDDVAHLVVFLSSDEAEYINGSRIYTDGGLIQYQDFQDDAV